MTLVSFSGFLFLLASVIQRHVLRAPVVFSTVSQSLRLIYLRSPLSSCYSGLFPFFWPECTLWKRLDGISVCLYLRIFGVIAGHLMRTSSVLTRPLSQCFLSLSLSELVFSLPRHCTSGCNWVLVGDYRHSIWGSIFNVLHFYLFYYVT